MMEGELAKMLEGRARKEEKTARMEEELARQRVAEDERQQNEKEMAVKKKQEGDTAKGVEASHADGPPAQSEAKAADPEMFTRMTASTMPPVRPGAKCSWTVEHSDEETCCSRVISPQTEEPQHRRMQGPQTRRLVSKMRQSFRVFQIRARPLSVRAPM